MDGNGRWATARNLPRIEGHRKGADAVRKCVEAAQDLGVQYLTLFAFSSENWKRPVEEVHGLMNLMRIYLKREMAELHKSNVKVKAIGELEKLDQDIRDLITQAEKLTANNDGLMVQIALSYGGRSDILQAAKSLISDVKDGKLDIDNINENDISSRLFTAGVPDPDLVIRTSGEHRLSNFLMWQLAYAEILFCATYWPDFSKQDLIDAFEFYQARDRRFGELKESTVQAV